MSSAQGPASIASSPPPCWEPRGPHLRPIIKVLCPQGFEPVVAEGVRGRAFPSGRRESNEFHRILGSLQTSVLASFSCVLATERSAAEHSSTVGLLLSGPGRVGLSTHRRRNQEVALTHRVIHHNPLTVDPADRSLCDPASSLVCSGGPEQRGCGWGSPAWLSDIMTPVSHYCTF